MEPQRSSLSFDASLPGIIHSFEACDSVEQFRDMALPRLGALFGADLVNFFQCGRDNKGNLNCQSLEVRAPRWNSTALGVFESQIRNSDPLVHLMQKKVHAAHFNTIKFSAFQSMEYNRHFLSYLHLLDSPNIITIVISEDDVVWASITIGRCAIKGDFSDDEVLLAQIISSSLNASFRAMLDRLRVRACSAATKISLSDQHDRIVALFLKSQMIFWDGEIAGRFELERRDVSRIVLSNLQGTSPQWLRAQMPHRNGHGRALLKPCPIVVDGQDIMAVYCRQAPNSDAFVYDYAPRLVTSREKEIIRLACTSATTKAIADDLGISIWTVKNHLKNIYSKYGISSRFDLAKLFPNDFLTG